MQFELGHFLVLGLIQWHGQNQDGLCSRHQIFDEARRIRFDRRHTNAALDDLIRNGFIEPAVRHGTTHYRFRGHK